MRLISPLLVLIVLVIIPFTALAQSEPSSEQGVSILQTGLVPECLSDPAVSATVGISCLQDSITHFTSLLLLIVAIGSFVYLLYGAFLYASAFGDEKKVEQGKKTITFALIGVVIAVLSRLAVELLRQALGAS